MDQMIAGATLLALGFFLYQMWNGRQATRRKQQDEQARRQQALDKTNHPAAIPKDVIARVRQQSPPSQPQPQPAPPRKRKKR